MHVSQVCPCMVTIFTWTAVGPGFKSWIGNLSVCYRINLLRRRGGFACVLFKFRGLYEWFWPPCRFQDDDLMWKLRTVVNRSRTMLSKQGGKVMLV